MNGGNIATLAFLNDSQKVKYLIIYLPEQLVKS